MIIAKDGDSKQEYRLDAKIGYVQMLEPRPDGHYICKDNGDGTGAWVVDDHKLAQLEQDKMRIELDWCDLMLKCIASGDTRRSEGLVSSDVYNYAIECRNYVTSTDGVLSVAGNAPVRPKK